MSKEQTDLGEFEGLVLKTAALFHGQLGVELEDLRQELRIKVWKVLGDYDPTRSKLDKQKLRLARRKFVYGCVANHIKDLKKEAARRSEPPVAGQRRCSWEPPVAYIEDQAVEGSLSAFESRYQNASHDEVYGAIEETLVRLPSTVVEEEKTILVYMMLGFTQEEIAEKTRVQLWLVKRRVKGLRQKLVDRHPSIAGEPAAVPQPVAA